MKRRGTEPEGNGDAAQRQGGQRADRTTGKRLGRGCVLRDDLHASRVSRAALHPRQGIDTRGVRARVPISSGSPPHAAPPAGLDATPRPPSQADCMEDPMSISTVSSPRRRPAALTAGLALLAVLVFANAATLVAPIPVPVILVCLD